MRQRLSPARVTGISEGKASPLVPPGGRQVRGKTPCRSECGSGYLEHIAAPVPYRSLAVRVRPPRNTGEGVLTVGMYVRSLNQTSLGARLIVKSWSNRLSATGRPCWKSVVALNFRFCLQQTLRGIERCDSERAEESPEARGPGGFPTEENYKASRPGVGSSESEKFRLRATGKGAPGAPIANDLAGSAGQVLPRRPVCDWTGRGRRRP